MNHCEPYPKKQELGVLRWFFTRSCFAYSTKPSDELDLVEKCWYSGNLLHSHRAMETMAHLVRWFSYYFNGDVPVRKLVHDERLTMDLRLPHQTNSSWLCASAASSVMAHRALWSLSHQIDRYQWWDPHRTARSQSSRPWILGHLFPNLRLKYLVVSGKRGISKQPFADVRHRKSKLIRLAIGHLGFAQRPESKVAFNLMNLVVQWPTKKIGTEEQNKKILK